MLAATSRAIPYAALHRGAATILWITLGVWLVGELRQSQRQRSEADAQDRGSRQLLRITIAGGWIVAAQAVRRVPGADIGHDVALVFWVGLALAWTGIAFRFWAFRTLGRYFTFTVMTSADQPVVTGGPYRLVRHPGYAGGALAMAGMGLAMGNWISFLALLVVPLIGTLNRIRVEEAALVATLGDEYRAFAAGRKRIVPFVW